jgi:hypothetical protein
VLQGTGEASVERRNMMSYATNRDRLEQADLIDPDADLSTEQEQAIESLTSGEVDALISTKAKLGPVFRSADVIGIKLHGLLE